jgi:hypothetical protein
MRRWVLKLLFSLFVLIFRGVLGTVLSMKLPHNSENPYRNMNSASLRTAYRILDKTPLKRTCHRHFLRQPRVCVF